jgi:hypothetical protein
VVQKVGNGKYVTPVMGEPLQKGTWKKAKKHDQPAYCGDSLVSHLITKFKKFGWTNSSSWDKDHVGRWGTFLSVRDAIDVDLINNFVDDGGYRFPTFVVKCEIKGDVHMSRFDGLPTFLSTHIRVVEEVGERYN